ncbi:MAG: YfiR family protein [Piscinibacter sp.]
MYRHALLLVAASLACASAAAQSAAPQGSVATVVAGILSYTRWPGEAAPIRLCLLGRGSLVDELQGSPEIGAAPRGVAVRTLSHAGQLRGACDAVYVSGHDAAAGREVLKATAGQPVLVLGEGAGFCSDGGMFCLEPSGTAVRFGANLDAIARSGLRVHPMVLRIARGATGGSP